MLATARAQAYPQWRQRWRRTLAPLDFLRVRELPLLLELWSRACPPAAVDLLDVASPQLLACHLARSRPASKVTYMNPFAPELADLEKRRMALRLDNLDTHCRDARDRDALPAESIDAAISASVFEHIADNEEGPGDSAAIRNVAGWLRPGGVLGLSVPFARIGFEETKKGPSYGASGSPGRPVFFQRFYDETSLRARLLEPSGMAVETVAFLGEVHHHPDNIHRRVASRFSGRWAPLLLGWSFQVLTRHFYRRSTDWSSLRKPYIAFVILRKTDGP